MTDIPPLPRVQDGCSESKTVFTAEWRVSDTTFIMDGDEFKSIIWEDDTPDANVWEVCSGLAESEAAHIVALHNASLVPPVREPQTLTPQEGFIRGVLWAQRDLPAGMQLHMPTIEAAAKDWAAAQGLPPEQTP